MTREFATPTSLRGVFYALWRNYNSKFKAYDFVLKSTELDLRLNPVSHRWCDLR